MSENQLDELHEARDRILEQLRRVVIGHDEVVRQLLIAFLTGGHCLLVGESGLAKTTLVNALADTMDLAFKRIQFTPDLMPSEITGTDLLQIDPLTGARSFVFQRGPVFANIVLADEVNRTPPKTQAALLQVMQEKMVSCGGRNFYLDEPFVVFGTQNPAEQDGTYPLPEAQLDRFLFSIRLRYPGVEQEIEIMRSASASIRTSIDPVLTRLDVLRLQAVVDTIPVDDSILRYIASLVQGTRPGSEQALSSIREWVVSGAGPRASIGILKAAKAQAALEGRTYVSHDDVRSVVQPVLRHRIRTNFSAAAEGITEEQIIERLMEEIQPGSLPGRRDP